MPLSQLQAYESRFGAAGNALLCLALPACVIRTSVTGAYRFREDHESLEEVSTLSANLLTYKVEHALSGEFLYEKWDAALLKQVGSLLSAKADGLRIDLQTSEFETLLPLFHQVFQVHLSTE
jgi:hypothetical protein